MIVADLELMWITTRAAGVVALVASTASVVLGLSLAGRVGAKRRRGILGDVRVLHQTLAIATLVALAVHLGTLMLDPWLRPSVIDVAVPFALDYRPLWTGLGIIAGYGLIVAALSGFLRHRRNTRWALVHRFAGLTWVMSIAHTLGAGTDAGTTWLLAVVLGCVVPVVVLLAMRLAPFVRNSAPTPTGARR